MNCPNCTSAMSNYIGITERSSRHWCSECGCLVAGGTTNVPRLTAAQEPVEKPEMQDDCFYWQLRHGNWACRHVRIREDDGEVSYIDTWGHRIIAVKGDQWFAARPPVVKSPTVKQPERHADAEWLRTMVRGSALSMYSQEKLLQIADELETLKREARDAAIDEKRRQEITARIPSAEELRQGQPERDADAEKLRALAAGWNNNWEYGPLPSSSDIRRIADDLEKLKREARGKEGS